MYCDQWLQSIIQQYNIDFYQYSNDDVLEWHCVIISNNLISTIHM